MKTVNYSALVLSMMLLAACNADSASSGSVTAENAAQAEKVQTPASIEPAAEAPVLSIDTSPPESDIEDSSSAVTDTDRPSEKRIQSEADRVERVCLHLYAYDPDDTTVNVRNQPNGEVVATVPNLSLVFRPDDYAWVDPNSWNDVELANGTQGYIWSDLLQRTAYRVYDPQDTFANLRQTPNGDILQAVPNDTEVEFLGLQGTWTQVRLPTGSEGYIASSLLTTPNCF